MCSLCRTETVLTSFVCALCRTKALVLELLAAVCLVSGGHDIILSAFDNFKEVWNPEFIIVYVAHTDCVLQSL